VRAPARVGDPAGAIDTPALVIDADALERNIATLAAYAAERGLRLRPHAKTHKSADIAQLQARAGAVGVCVQKVSEAEALADAGVSDIYISNEVVDAAKLDRLAALARRVPMAVAVDSDLGVQRLGQALERAQASMNVLVEVDVGHGRCGLPPGAAAALARHVAGHPAMRFAGLQAYHGRAQHLRTAPERDDAIRHAASRVRAAQAALSAAGISCPLVTGAGTGTFVHEAASGVWGELQCGSYVFMDRDYADNDPPAADSPRFEHALFVATRVMSRGASHAVIDAGHKSHALDSGPPRVWGADLEWANGGDEHGILRARGATALPGLDERVWLMPGHCDPTVNLHDTYVVVRGGLQQGVVEAVWPVHARGCVA
jgi:D-serine deaminase-like pyridoxal phosphate-dependent protein